MSKKRYSTFELREIGLSGKKIHGVIPYNSESLDLGGFREVLLPGCFSESLNNGTEIMSLWGHDRNQPLASTSNNTLIIKDRPDGLYFTIDPAPTSYGKDLLELVKNGTVRNCSFGFNPIDDKWEGGLREILKADLFEISPCVFAAYPETTLDLRKYKYNGGTNMTIREKIIDLYDHALKIKEDAEASEQRSLTPEQNREFMDIMLRYDNMDPEQFGFPRFADAGFDGVHRHITTPVNEPIKPIPDSKHENRVSHSADSEYRFSPNGKTLRDSYNRYLLDGPHALTDFEYRALQADSDIAGGFLTSPVEVSEQIIKGLDNLVFVRRLAKKVTIDKAESIGFPYLDHHVQDPTWKGELSEADLDTSMDFERRDLHPYRMALGIKVSRKLLRISKANPENIVRDSLLYKGAVVQENTFLNGTGANQPMGVFTVSDFGIGTDRDCNTGNTATQIKPDNLIECEGQLKEQYLNSPSLAWVFSRQAITRIRKMKDGEGQYLWSQGLSGRKNEILGIQYFRSEYCPSTFSANSYVGILGDFQFYYIVDALQMEIQRLIEKYALSDQDAFLMNCYCDGGPVLSDAFVRVQLGS